MFLLKLSIYSKMPNCSNITVFIGELRVEMIMAKYMFSININKRSCDGWEIKSQTYLVQPHYTLSEKH